MTSVAQDDLRRVQCIQWPELPTGGPLPLLSRLGQQTAHVSDSLLQNREIHGENETLPITTTFLDSQYESRPGPGQLCITAHSHSQPESWEREAAEEALTGAGLSPGSSDGAVTEGEEETRQSPAQPAPPRRSRPGGGSRGNRNRAASVLRPGRAMAAAIELERLLAAVELRCSLCLQFFSEPVRIAGCSHSFCRRCISRYRAGRPGPGCPLCREGFELRDLRPNRELAALLSLIPPELSEEKLETEDEPSGAVVFGDRSSAGGRPGEKEEEIWESSKLPEISVETIPLLRRDLSKTKEYTSQIKSQITRDFCCMKEYVERQERSTLMFIEQEQKAAQQKIEETIHQLTDSKAQTSNLPYEGSLSIMYKITLDEKLNVVKSAVEDLKRKLEMLLLEKYPQQFPPVQPPKSYQETSVCSSPPESAAEIPDLVIPSQSSQWAEDVTFDHTRANERLALTAQNSRVVVSGHPTWYEPTPRRFCISQVMCSQSFSTGCHYWEVITKDSDGWAVGVAHEMIGKRDKLGRTEHSWCVEWLGSKKQLSAWHKDQETLLHKDKPLRVGVFLELQKQTVSFYSITDREILLHTFELSTSHPLYPAFWLYSLERNGSLTLSHPNRR